MADLDSLYTALKNADAAGDTEAAKTLSNYINSVLSEQETEEAPAVEEQPKDITKAPVSATKTRSVPRAISDQLVGLSQGVVGMGQMAQGLEDLVSMGYIGKARDMVREFYKSKGIPVPSLEDINNYLQSIKSEKRQATEQ